MSKYKIGVEIPKVSRYPSTDALRQAIDPSRQLILPNLPKEYLDRVLPLLKFTSTDPCTGLALRFTQQPSRALLITHFPNRPWDWGESLEEGVVQRGDDTRSDYATRPRRAKQTLEQHRDEWHMKTVIGSETVFQREWVDSRVLDVSKREEGESSDEEMVDRAEEEDDEVPSGGQQGSGVYGKKRKASMSSIDEGMISDDDVQIIEGPDQGGR
ncbi:mediator complex subunit Med12 [Rhizoctonia solani]|uniref:Mediator complex subunit Med12 n=1 Tax=Rhizoctonia solani TaxID=456999 RepID=A0A8H8NZ11_9AGAM|nr:mediator complex subunit Med12 [Rhizoctonia solani]QRW21285.1 mediator complex subunit Med12 [Rhizoctonia solani]